MSEVLRGEEIGEMSAEEIVTPPEATLDDLWAQYEQPEGEFTYTVGEGAQARTFRARRLMNLSEKMAITEAAEAFRKKCDDPRTCPESWRPYLVKKINRKVAIAILFAEKLILSPRISQRDGLRLAATCGDALLEIVGPVMSTAEEDATEGTYQEIVDAKNA